MIMIETLPHAAWTEKGGVWWMNCDGASVRQIAEAMRDARARFMTITARQLPGSAGFRLDYHWDLEGRLLGFSFETPVKAIDSIVDLCEAADWIEREVYEGFGIEFSGRTYEPLQLRAGLQPGVNLREEATR